MSPLKVTASPDIRKCPQCRWRSGASQRALGIDSCPWCIGNDGKYVALIKCSLPAAGYPSYSSPPSQPEPYKSWHDHHPNQRWHPPRPKVKVECSSCSWFSTRTDKDPEGTPCPRCESRVYELEAEAKRLQNHDCKHEIVLDNFCKHCGEYLSDTLRRRINSHYQRASNDANNLKGYPELLEKLNSYDMRLPPASLVGCALAEPWTVTVPPPEGQSQDDEIEVDLEKDFSIRVWQGWPRRARMGRYDGGRL